MKSGHCGSGMALGKVAGSMTDFTRRYPGEIVRRKPVRVVFGGDLPVVGKCYERMVAEWERVGP